MKKVVTNSGDWDGTVLYLRDGVAAGASAGRICETQDGPGNMAQRFIHATQLIDELVCYLGCGSPDDCAKSRCMMALR